MQIDTHGPGTSSGLGQSELRKKPSKMRNPRSAAGWYCSGKGGEITLGNSSHSGKNFITAPLV